MSSPSAPPPPPASSSKKATIERLLQAARTEFSDKGLDGARMDEIARAAGVTKQVIYNHFGSKEQLFASVLDASADRITAELLALDLDALPPREALRLWLTQVFDQYNADRALGPLAQQGLRFHDAHVDERSRFPDLAPALAQQMRRLLERGQASGDFRPDVDPRLFMAASSLLTTGGFTNRYMISAVAGFDSTSAEGVEAWRSFSVSFVLSAVLVDQRPPLARPLDEMVPPARAY